MGKIKNMPKEVSMSQLEQPQPCPEVSLEELRQLPTDHHLYESLTAEAEAVANTICLPESQKVLWMAKVRQINASLDRGIVAGELVPFGSSCNGFSTRTSDLDLCFSLSAREAVRVNPEKLELVKKKLGEDRLNEELEKILFECIVKALLESGFDIEDIKSKFGARTPILCAKNSEFELDIAIKSQVAIENTKLLLTYSQFDERAAKLGMLIKFWAKKRRLSHAVNRVLCSYAFILMVIRFLQEELILPNLQADYPEGADRLIVDSHDCSFEADLSLYAEMRGQNHSSLGELLVRFFHYYSFFDWSTRCVSIKLYTQRKSSLYPHSIMIQDPFEKKRNLGDTCSRDNEEIIVNEFKRAYKMLCEGASFARVCED